MTLKNLMEEKQLNFNQPLLSVRRGSSTTTTAPPEVNKRKVKNSHPSLPPLPYYKSELKSGPVRNPGAVPFQWEQTPGKPKDENKPPRENLNHLPLAPKLPPGRIVNHNQKSADKVPKDSPASSSRSLAENNLTCPSEISSADEGAREETEEKDASSSEDDNIIYEDARDKISRTDSFFVNCSFSGVTGLDDPDMEPSRTFSDPQARDFMMGRFLPAAKAVASETPHFASRKHPVARKQQNPPKAMVNPSKRTPQYFHIPDTSPHGILGEGEGEEEEEDEEDEYGETEDLPATLCGLLPKFCLLNPIPGLRDHAEAISSVRSVRTRPAYNGAFSRTEDKDKTNNHRGEMNTNTRHHASTNVSSTRGHLSRNGIPSYKDGSPLSFLDRENTFLGLPKESRDFKDGKLDLPKKGYTKHNELSEHHGAAEEITTTPASPAPIRTLYVDSEQMVEFRDSNSSSSESRGRNPSVDYSLQDFKSFCGADDKALFRESNQDAGLAANARASPKANVKEATKKSSPPLALAPLLPKSPSESWLSRTLPSISSKYPPNSKSYLINPAFRQSPVDPKRDRMVKASNVQDLIFRSPGDLAPILES